MIATGGDCTSTGCFSTFHGQRVPISSGTQNTLMRGVSYQELHLITVFIVDSTYPWDLATLFRPPFEISVNNQPTHLGIATVRGAPLPDIWPGLQPI